MNNVQVFSNSQFGEIRIAMSSKQEPLFCLMDVCKALDLKNSRDVKSRLSAKGVATTDTLTSGGIQSLTYISEPNLYRCIFQSRKKEAEMFQDWVVEEVLPTIRKTGCYSFDLSKYVPLHEYREQVRLAEFERREAETWYRRSQAYLSLLEKSAENQAKMSQAMLSLSQASAVSVPAAPQSSEWMTVVGYASLHNIPCSLSMAGQLGRKATDMCAKQGITPDTIPDPRFGRVNTYPIDILKKVFEIKR